MCTCKCSGRINLGLFGLWDGIECLGRGVLVLRRLVLALLHEQHTCLARI